MPFIKLNFRPGINRDQTNYSNEGGWYDCDKIRFRSGFPEKIGGWVRNTPNRFIGTCRQLWNWITSFSDNILALGTNVKLYLELSGVFYNITPIRDTFVSPATDDCLTFTQASNIVQVYLPAHGCTTGDYVQISGVVAYGAEVNSIGQIPLSDINANHKVTVIDGDNFTFEVPVAANFGIGWNLAEWSVGAWGIGDIPSTVTTGGTNITIECEITSGYAYTVPGYGWGTSVWGGDNGWGLGSVQSSLLPQRDWWFDNFDNDLVMNIRKNFTDGGQIYYWERGSDPNPATALSTRAVLLSSLPGASDVPAEAMQILVSQNDKHLLAFGATPFGGGDFDPLLIRWADQDNPRNWTPTPTNSAGFIRVSRGSEIIRALPTRQEVLTWTNSHLYSLQFTGTTDVFSLQELADNISIIGPRACASASNITFWMGQDKFYAYTGRVETLPCTLRSYVFQDIDYSQTEQIICGTNEGWQEVWWFYPSKNSNWVNRYVVYNYYEKVWYFGQLGRTAWLDSPMRQYPQAVFTDFDQNPGILYDHEFGVDADGEPLAAYIQSSDFDISDGEQFMLSRRLIPDVNFAGSVADAPEVKFEIRPRNFPGSTFRQDPSDTQRVIEAPIGQYTDEVFIRARARQMALKVMSENLGVQWQLGSPRLDARTDGKR